MRRRSGRCRVALPPGGRSDQAAIFLRFHDPLPGGTAWHRDPALSSKWHTSPAPTAVKGLSGAVIGHLDAPIAGPPTGTTVMMTFCEKVEDADGKSYSAVTDTRDATGALTTEVRDRNDGQHAVGSISPPRRWSQTSSTRSTTAGHR